MATYGTYTWPTQGSSDENDWTFDSPLGPHNVKTPNTDRYWCWDNNDTTSSNVGPTSGQGGSPEGYLYTEASSPTAANDEFTMTFNTALDASANTILITFYTNQRGNSNDSNCYVQTNEGGAGWVTRATFGGSGDPNKVASGGTQIWASRSVDLTGIVSNASTQIRIMVKMPASGTIWNNDYGIDTVTITTTATGGSGWGGGTINGVTSLGKVNTVDDADISTINKV